MQEVSEQRKNQSGCVAKPAGCSLSLSLSRASFTPAKHSSKAAGSTSGIWDSFAQVQVV